MPKVTMPQLGESVAEGTIGKWLKKPGDSVAKYEPLLEVITDKVNAEVPSPYEGILKEILVEEGATVPNNAEIAVIEEAGEAAGEGAPETAGSSAGQAAGSSAGRAAGWAGRGSGRLGVRVKGVAGRPAVVPHDRVWSCAGVPRVSPGLIGQPRPGLLV